MPMVEFTVDELEAVLMGVAHDASSMVLLVSEKQGGEPSDEFLQALQDSARLLLPIAKRPDKRGFERAMRLNTSAILKLNEAYKETLK